MVRTAKRAWGGAWGRLLAIGIPGQGPAQAECPSTETAAEIGARVRETNRSLLQALIARRAEVEQMDVAAEQKRVALEFLDRRIAKVKSQIEQASK